MYPATVHTAIHVSCSSPYCYTCILQQSIQLYMYPAAVHTAIHVSCSSPYCYTCILQLCCFYSSCSSCALLWLYCPGHAGAKGNDRTDRLAGKATLTSGLLLGRSEVLRSLRHYLRAQSQGHHTTVRLEEKGVERGSARRSSLEGERAIVSQTNVGTVSKATLGKLLRDGVDAYGLF